VRQVGHVVKFFREYKIYVLVSFDYSGETAINVGPTGLIATA